jgi:cell division protein FtsX
VLSIYLLLQKNTTKLENLMLIGYSPSRIARPYQGLTIALNALIFCGGIGIVCAVRAAYMEVVENLFPQGIGSQGILPALLTGGVLFIAVCLLNIVIIRRKINFIWWERMKKK